jgi:alkanesulfonate monooxygenase SsuD/methylene tetrahydromethanopterin reductase-like flavin-dependent oxidoreductase (luciferase family)
MSTAGSEPTSAIPSIVPDTPTRYGLVLPHFGEAPNRDRLLSVARRAEAAGFDSLWVRDRLVAGAPHGLLLEAGGTTFFEPLLTLAAVSSVTERIALGTAVLLPNRHPLRLAQQLGTLTRLAPDRLLIGFGLGVGPANFEGLGLDYEERRALFEEIVQVLHGWPAVEPQEHVGTHFRFGPVQLDPPPLPRPPLYYGGVSRAAVRRAFQYADGWIAGRLPRDTFRERMTLVDRYRAETGRDIDIATMPITLVDSGDGRHADAARHVVAQLAGSAEGARDWIKPPSGRFETVDDLSGLLIAGDLERCAAEIGSILESGVTHLIFDLRLVFDDIENQIDLLAGSVLPRPDSISRPDST